MDDPFRCVPYALKRRFAGRWTRWAAVSGSGKGQAQRACARAVLCRGGIWRDQKYGILKTFYRISVCIAERVGLERVNSSFLSLAYAIDQPKARRIKLLHPPQLRSQLFRVRPGKSEAEVEAEARDVAS